MTVRMLKKFLILLLMLDAALIFVLQTLQLNSWPLICLYWFILTVRNAFDVVS